MASNVIVKQHIDNFLVTSTLAGAQSTLGINPSVNTVVQSNSAAWDVSQGAISLKANSNNPNFTGLLSSSGPVVINTNSALNALRITQTGTGPALLVEDSANPDASPFIITAGGDVGIGKIPSSKLEIESSDTIARFNGTLSQGNGIAINNTFANAATYKLGYVDFRNENNVTVSNIYSNINQDGSSDLIFTTTLSGDRTTRRTEERLRIINNGNIGVGTATPGAKLHVNGNIICSSITTSQPINATGLVLANASSTLFIPTSCKVQFGSPGDNTDDFYIQRINSGQYFGGKSELRIHLGDDPQANGVFSPASATQVDSIVIGVNGYLPWQPKIVLESHGLISCFGDYLPSNSNPLTATPAMPVSAAHLTTKSYVDQFRTPPGAIMTFAMSSAPTGWLYCNGQQVSRTTYSALFSAIGTTYGVGNGTTTFHLPDLRGEFIRGWDNGRGIDSGRTFGSTQKGTITVADPNLNSLNVAGIYCQYEYNTNTFAPVAGYDVVNINDYAGVYRAHISGTGFGALETNGFAQGATRPRNIALYYCIKT